MIPLEKDFLVGSYPPVITPFRDGEVDFDAYEKLIARQVEGGSQGVVVNGTTAEPSTLTLSERNDLVRLAVQVADGRIPVVAATGSQSYAETRMLSEAATAAGVAALLIVTPYYLQPPQRGLVEYFSDLCGRFELPVMLYHIPGRAAVKVEVSTLEEVAERSANFVGMKHAVNDLQLVSDALSVLGSEFRIFVGLEELSFPMLAIGAQGLMNAVSNLLPGRVSDLWRAMDQGDLAEGRRLHFELLQLNRAVFFDTNPIAVKYMLRRLGVLECNEHRLPMVPATPELESRLDVVLRNAGLI